MVQIVYKQNYHLTILDETESICFPRYEEFFLITAGWMFIFSGLTCQCSAAVSAECGKNAVIGTRSRAIADKRVYII